MFVTSPAFAQWMPPAIAAPNTHFWRAVQLSTSMPWFLVTLTLQDDGESSTETFAVAWEKTLIEMIKSASEMTIHSIQMLVRPDDGRLTWCSRDVEEIWIPSELECSNTGPLVLRFAGTKDLTSSLLTRVCEAPGRELLVRIPGQ